MNKRFWKNKRVFMTGHTGFKGSWLVLWLKALGADVTGYALKPPTRPSLFDDAGAGKGMTSIIADVRDLGRLKKEIRAHRPEIVFHLAAQSVVRTSYEDPVGTYGTNVMGTVNLFEALRDQSGVKVILNVTSDKCYENKEWVWGYRESDELGGYDPYSNSKACSELVTRAYRSSFFSAGRKTKQPAIATARAGNVIGGGDWTKDQLVPDVIRALLGKRKVVLRNPNATRPWQFVLDALHGYLCLAEALWAAPEAYEGAWNFGPGASGIKTVEWIASQILCRWEGNRGIRVDGARQPHEASLLQLDASKAARALHWQPALGLNECIGWIADWYRGYAAGRDVTELSMEQIMQFQKRVQSEVSDNTLSVHEYPI